MKRIIVAALLAVALSGSTGCFLPIYSADPAERAEELIVTSDNLRALKQDWKRLWFLDQPDHMKSFRTHGGIN